MFAMAVRLISAISFKISEAGLFWWDGDIEGRVKKGWKAGRRPKGGNMLECGTLKPNRPKDFFEQGWTSSKFAIVQTDTRWYSAIVTLKWSKMSAVEYSSLFIEEIWRNHEIIFSRPRRGSHRRIQLRRWTHGGKLSIQRLGSGKFLGVELIYCLGYLGHWWTRRLYT